MVARFQGDDGGAAAALPRLGIVHGCADVGAAFQFVVDELARLEGGPRHVLAPDWRGFGQSQNSGDGNRDEAPLQEWRQDACGLAGYAIQARRECPPARLAAGCRVEKALPAGCQRRCGIGALNSLPGQLLRHS